MSNTPSIWHFKQKKTGILYMEWKYFNFVGKDLSGFISYAIANPANKFGLRRIILTYAFYTDKSRGQSIDITKNTTHISTTNFFVGRHKILQFNSKNAPTFNLEGDDKDIKWKLTYKPTSKAQVGLRNYKVGIFNWEDLSWEAPALSAKVTGTVTIGNKNYKVRASGYHDGNWGTWLGLDAMWQWLQLNQKDTSIILAEIYNMNKGSIFVDSEGKISRFTKKQFKVEQHFWIDNPYGRIPVKCRIIADNGRQKLDLTVTSITECTTHIKRPLLFGQGVHITFQKSRITGTFTDGMKKKRIRTIGFWEYTNPK